MKSKHLKLRSLHENQKVPPPHNALASTEHGIMASTEHNSIAARFTSRNKDYYPASEILTQQRQRFC